MNWGNINFVKSDKGNYRKYVVIEISTTDNKSNMPYVITYGLEEIVGIPSAPLYCQLDQFTDWE